MSNAVFPTLPGLSWGVERTSGWKTQIEESISGREARAARMKYPVWHFTLKYEILRAQNGFWELQTLVGFFNARNGAFDSFLFLDPDAYTVYQQSIGAGDGVKTSFPLTRSIGGFVEPIGATTYTPTIRVGGVANSAWTLNANSNIVTFSSPPANGAAIDWTGNYYTRVRFARDQMETRKFLKDLWEAQKVELRSDKG